MSQLSYAWEQPTVEGMAAPPAMPWYEPPERSIWQPILMVPSLILAAGGYFLTAPMLTDMSFLFLTVVCFIFLIGDLRRFSESFGLGGIVLFGGVLIWFCYDYFETWFLAWLPRWNMPFTPQVVGKAAACHMLYILCMTIGLRIRRGRWLPKLMTRLPEPHRPSDYFWVVIITQIIGLSPYFIFTREPFYLAIYHATIGGRSGLLGTQWTVGRSGNLNYSWGAYVAQMLQVGDGGAVLASFCIVFLRQGFLRNVVCAGVWLLWVAIGFGTGTRGDMVILLLPFLCFIFIRYHVQAQEFLHRYSPRAYVASIIVLLFAVVLIQIQARYRDVGFTNVSLNKVSFFHLEGNEMFSTGLAGYSLIPERHDYFYDSFPGEMFIMPIPNFVFWIAVAPMPRALWTTKPIDPFWKWYNAVFTGRSTAGGGTTEGTTIAEGIVGYWFFRFGIAGIIEGGLLMGWIIGCAERALLNNQGRPMAVLFSLGILTWLFRSFRSVGNQDLMQVLVAMGGMVIVILVLRPFLGGNASV